MERKRKMQRTRPQGSNARIRVGSSSQGPNFHLGQQIGKPRMQAMGQGFKTPQRQIQRPNFQTSRSALLPSQRNSNAQNSGVVGPCYSCGQTGHYTNQSPRKQANQTLAPRTNQHRSRGSVATAGLVLPPSIASASPCHGCTAASATPHPAPISPSPSINPHIKTPVKSEPFCPH
jgi:hypothetical protein